MSATIGRTKIIA